MSQTLRETATIDFEKGIATTCERDRCHEDDHLHAWIATGEFGPDAIVVFCPECSQNVGEVRPSYSYVGEVTDYGGQDDA